MFREDIVLCEGIEYVACEDFVHMFHEDSVCVLCENIAVS